MILLAFNLYSASTPAPSFQRPMLSAPEPVSGYIQGSPIITLNYQYFTMPQVIFIHVSLLYNLLFTEYLGFSVARTLTAMV